MSPPNIRGDVDARNLFLSPHPAVELSLINKAKKEWLSIQAIGTYVLKCLQAEVGQYWDCILADAIMQRDTMLDRLRGEVVVELGCGPGPRKFQQLLAQNRPAYYVGVDQGVSLADHVVEMSEVGPFYNTRVNSGDLMDGMFVKADMLDSISRLPDNFGSYVINGIDEYILDSNSDYAVALMGQIGRTTKHGGVILGVTAGGGILTELPNHVSLETEQIMGAYSMQPNEGYFCHSKL